MVGDAKNCLPNTTSSKKLGACSYCDTKMPWQELRECGQCRGPLYCDRKCQRLHWKAGHKHVCEQVPSCTICLDNCGPKYPIQSGCGCRDANGRAHVVCKALHAAHQGPGFHDGWFVCPTCLQEYTGAMHLGLAEAVCARLNGRPAEDNERLWAQNSLAGAYFQAGRFAEAEALYRAVLATRRRVDGPNHEDTLAGACNLGSVLCAKGDDPGAETVFRDTLERQQVALGPDHESTLMTASGLAGALQNQNRYTEALPILEHAHSSMQGLLGKNDIATMTAAINLVEMCTNVGGPDHLVKAEGLGRDILTRARLILGPDHPHTLLASAALARALGRQGAFTEYMDLTKDTHARLAGLLGQEHPDTLEAARHLGIAVGEHGETGEAITMLNATLASQQRVLGTTNPRTQQTAEALSNYQCKSLAAAFLADTTFETRNIFTDCIEPDQ
mgnify:CR=1 FL=1